MAEAAPTNPKKKDALVASFVGSVGATGSTGVVIAMDNNGPFLDLKMFCLPKKLTNQQFTFCHFNLQLKSI